MTPLERAETIVARHREVFGTWLGISDLMVDWIREAIVEATNTEVKRRRAVEAERDRLQRIVDAFSAPDQPIRSEMDYSENHLRLRLLNPATGDWWEISATKEGEVGHA